LDAEAENHPYLLELDSVSYMTHERRFFESVTLRLESGNILCIVGPSGQGKSMLCSVAAGLVIPTSGTVKLLGRDTASCSYAETQRLRRRIGFVFQRSALLANMTIEENISLPLLYHTQLTQTEIGRKVSEMLESMELEETAAERPAGLPEMAVQRANIARALIMEPEIIFLDEPLEDTGFGRRVHRIIKPLLKKLAREKNVGVFIVSRDVHFAYRTADRIGFMEDGVLVEEGTVEEMSLSRQSTRVGFLRELTSHISRMRMEEAMRKGSSGISLDAGSPAGAPAADEFEDDGGTAENVRDDARKEPKTTAFDVNEVPDISIDPPGDDGPSPAEE